MASSTSPFRKQMLEAFSALVPLFSPATLLLGKVTDGGLFISELVSEAFWGRGSTPYLSPDGHLCEPAAVLAASQQQSEHLHTPLPSAFCSTIHSSSTFVLL